MCTPRSSSPDPGRTAKSYNPLITRRGFFSAPVTRSSYPLAADLRRKNNDATCKGDPWEALPDFSPWILGSDTWTGGGSDGVESFLASAQPITEGNTDYLAYNVSPLPASGVTGSLHFTGVDFQVQPELVIYADGVIVHSTVLPFPGGVYNLDLSTVVFPSGFLGIDIDVYTFDEVSFAEFILEVTGFSFELV